MEITTSKHRIMIAYKTINHRNTSLKEREHYFTKLNDSSREPSVFLQTCNRMELYYGEGDVPQDVARHLFRVVCGLESAIVGERAVQGQVKDAYIQARTQQKLPAGIHKLFECALEVGKRVRNETEISHGAVSHSLAAIEIIEDEKVDVEKARIVIIGVNKLTSDIIKFLQNKGARHILLGNRTVEKAREMVADIHVEVFSLEEKQDYLKDADIVISATSAKGYVIDGNDLQTSHKTIAIDLAFPRDINPDVCRNKDVTLYNLQDVEGKVQKNISVREDEVKKAETIIEEEIDTLEEIMERRKIYAR